jgi:RNA polymerase sigma-70 factor (ECF subfamily)
VADLENEQVHKAITGDRDALVELLAVHGPRIRDSLVGSIPRRWQAVLSVDDVMQQAYTDAFRAIGRFEPREAGSFGGWLATLAKRNLVDALRGLEADKRGGDRRRVEAPDDGSYVALYEMIEASMTTPSGGAARDEARERLRECLAQLPEDYRTLIELYDLQGRGVEEVASALSRSAGAVYMLRARAHRKLAELMGGASEFFTTS